MLFGSAYWKVARPSSAQVISKMLAAPFTPLTRIPLRTGAGFEVHDERFHGGEERCLLARVVNAPGIARLW